MLLRAGEAHCLRVLGSACGGGIVWGKGAYGSATGILPSLNCGRVYAAGWPPGAGEGGDVIFCLTHGVFAGSVDEVKRKRDASMSRG